MSGEIANLDEIARARSLTEVLARQVRVAKWAQVDVRLSLPDAEELLQLLSDSLRSIEGLTNGRA